MPKRKPPEETEIVIGLGEGRQITDVWRHRLEKLHTKGWQVIRGEIPGWALQQSLGYLRRYIDKHMSRPPKKAEAALARYDALVAAGRSTDRQHHWKTKKDACAGICSVRALEKLLQQRGHRTK
jgi:hypothetical protein